MEALAYYDGKIGTPEELMVPFNDRVHFFGDGVYDATVGANGKVYLMQDHLDRFYTSTKALDIHIPMPKEELGKLLTDLLAAYGADACQDLVLIPFKTNLEDSDLTTEEYNLTGLLDYPILANAGCFAIQDTGDAAALKSAESAVLWLYSSGDGEKALTDTLGVITPWNTASDTTTLGAMQVKQVNTAILPGIDLPTAAAAQALTANEEALQGGTRGKAERTAFTQAALAALGAE